MTLVHEVDDPHKADLTVEVVKSQGVADLLVHRVEGGSPSLRNEAVWCFSGERTPSSKAIHFTHRQGHAHLRVCFVKSPGLCGWLKRHKLRGRLS